MYKFFYTYYLYKNVGYRLLRVFLVLVVSYTNNKMYKTFRIITNLVGSM